MSRLTITVSRYCSRKRSSVAAQSVATKKFVRGSATGRMVLLVRNASAVSRTIWEGDDVSRPLDACGWAQADELVRLLAHFDPTVIRAADVRRCEQTVEPLAASLGISIDREQLLAETRFAERRAEVMTMVRTIGGTHDCVVLCSQGEVIPDLVSRLSAQDDVDLPEPATSRKASVWALELQAGRVVNAVYFPPPDPPECGQAVS